MPKQILMNIGKDGIVLLKIADMVEEFEMAVLARHSLSDIYRWAYKPEVNFYFEIKVRVDMI